MEPHVFHRDKKPGWIEVICGSMFSGKTEELIRRLKRARIARQKVEIFKPALDNRYAESEVVSHDENAIPSTPVDAAAQILLLAGGADVIGIDEAQFFDAALVEVCEQLARDGKRVIVTGLDQDYLGAPFEPIPQLMAVAEYVTKLHAICVVCGAPANHSQRLVRDGHRLLLGAKESYEPRCRRCFDPHGGVSPEAGASEAEASGASSESEAPDATEPAPSPTRTA
ncbi:thymidine kinase [Rhodocaloribacter sp.]